jgi:hypothetical protein
MVCPLRNLSVELHEFGVSFLLCFWFVYTLWTGAADDIIFANDIIFGDAMDSIPSNLMLHSCSITIYK